MVRFAKDPFPSRGPAVGSDLDDLPLDDLAPRAIDRHRAFRRRRTELRKQISLFLSVTDWRLLRQAAAQKRIPITRLLQEAIEPLLRPLREAAGRKE